MSRLFFWIEHVGSYEGNSGVQRVTRALARELDASDRDLVYVGWSEDDYALVRAGPREVRNLGRYGGPPERDQPAAGLPLHKNGVDEAALEGAWLLVPEVTHFTRHGPQVTEAIIDYCRNNGIKVAFVFYDLIPLISAGYDDLRAAHEVYVQQIALADLVLPISAYAGETLRAYYRDRLGLPETEWPQISPVPLGEAFGAGERPPIAAEPAKGPVHLVSLGTIEPRKNQAALLRAFNALCARRPELDLTLSLVGNLHPGVAEEVEALVRANPRVEYRSYLPDREVAELYRSCHFSVFPSVEEGYGLPIVESLWFGRPVICAGFGAMAEVAAGGGCLQVDTRSEAEIEAAIERLATETAVRRRLAVEAGARAFRTWADYAADIEARMAEHAPFRRVWYWAHGTILEPYNSGVQRVARAFARGLEEVGVRVDLVKWDPSSQDLAPLADGERAHFARWNGPRGAGGPPPAPQAGEWLIVPELLAGVSPSAGDLLRAARRKGLKVAFVLYDMLPLKLSEKAEAPPDGVVYDRHVAEAYEAYWREAAEADALVAISQAVADEFAAWYRRVLPRLVNLDWKLTATPLAADFASAPRPRPAAPARDGVVRILNVSTIEPRKNQLRLVRAVKRASERPGAPPMRLTVIGSHQPYPELVAQLQQEIEAGAPATLVDGADDAALARAYEEADFVVYSSYAEGFGLPILESLWYGRPCLAHGGGALGETAQGGGVVLVDMLDEDAITDAVFRLAGDRAVRAELAAEAQARTVKQWSTYALEFLRVLEARGARPQQAARALPAFRPVDLARSERPLLSICITTYNRAGWLKHSLERLLELTRPYRDVIEVLVCDNAATDATPEVVRALQAREDFGGFRNPRNVGMLGNLGVTAKHARGEFVWLLGDDDLLVPGAIEDVLEGLVDHPDVEMAYLNYAYTHFNTPEDVEDPAQVIAGATPIADGGPNRRVDRLREVALMNENLFTAIYCCVFRRRHAVSAYTQNTAGQPFSSLLTCVPSTVYTLNMLLDRPAYWIGRPSVVVNMNVSWREHVLLWHLERMPELYDWSERQGLWSPALESFRLNHASAGVNGVRHLFFEAPDAVRRNFSVERLLDRCMHLDEFRERLGPELLAAYREARAQGRVPPDRPSAEELSHRYGLKLDASASAAAR